MKKIFSVILSVLVSLTIVMCTIVQFHHHDRYGNIYITLSVAGQIKLDSHGHFDTACHHHHENGCHGSDKEDDASCSMHLDETRPAVIEHLKILLPQTVILFADMQFSYPPITFLATDMTGRECMWIETPLIYSSIDSPIVTRRGPPYFIA